MAQEQTSFFSHQTLEKNIGWMIVMSLVAALLPFALPDEAQTNNKEVNRP